jgi:hypothetical protein
MRTALAILLASLAAGCVMPPTYGQPPGGYYQRTYLPPLPPNARFQVPPAGRASTVYGRTWP